MNEEKYINDIEILRDKLHDKIIINKKDNKIFLNDEDLLKTSNELDNLILKYMKEIEVGFNIK